MNRNQPLAAFVLALVLLSQSGCCCCVTIPTGPEPGDGGETGFGEFLPPETAPEEGEDSIEAPEPAENLESVEEITID